MSEAAEALGAATSTLRRWEASGKMVAEHTVGGHRRYDLAKPRPELFRAAEAAQRKTIGYARVSSHDQKDDLERQKQLLELYCARQGWTFEVVADLGSPGTHPGKAPASAQRPPPEPASVTACRAARQKAPPPRPPRNGPDIGGTAAPTSQAARRLPSSTARPDPGGSKHPETSASCGPSSRGTENRTTRVLPNPGNSCAYDITVCPRCGRRRKGLYCPLARLIRILSSEENVPCA
jgi:putative resolvase